MMTFNELRTEILDRLNLSSTEASVRVGRAINRKYRLVTTAIGLQLSRRTTTSRIATIGASTFAFLNTEKVISVTNRSTSPYKNLVEITLDELHARMPFVAGDNPTHYAIRSHTSDTVTIEVNRLAETAYSLNAEVHQAVSDLSGTDEPAFPESYHDVLIEGVMSDELRKLEKPQLAQIAAGEYQRILSDLRMWIAKNNYIDNYQGKLSTTTAGSITGSGSGGGSSVDMASVMARISLRA